MPNTPAAVIDAINAAWRTGDVDDLANYFSPHMVIVGPDYQPMARGVDACVASYRDFLRVSTVREYKQSALMVHEADPVAVVTFNWEMDYEQGGRRSREAGSDLFVLRRRDGQRWQAVWRAVTFTPVSSENKPGER
jgi:ketosteroid isomerase-like protein